MPKCCGTIHVGWICPRCGKRMAIKPHSGNDPVPIGRIAPPQIEQNITVVKGDYVQGSVIKDSVVMGDVSENPSPEIISAEGEIKSSSIVEDSIVIDEELDI